MRCCEHFGNNVALPQIEFGFGFGDVIRASIRVSRVSQALLILKFPGFLERCHSQFRPDFVLQERLRRPYCPQAGILRSFCLLYI
jgi:hypothetical protein